MDYETRPLNDNSDQAVRERDHQQGIAEDAKLDITVELTIDGKSVYRKFRTYAVSDIDWNPHINDMAESIAKSEEDPIK
jgi:hypothetical protein